MTDPFWIVLGLGLINALTSLLGFTSIAEKLLSCYAWCFKREAHGAFLKSWRELKEARQALAEISAQDEFAKWARQQRLVDKLQADYDRQSGERQRALLAKTMGLALLLRVLLYAVIFWVVSIKYLRVGMACRLSPIMGPLVKLLSLPYGPTGMTSLLILILMDLT